MSSNWALNLIDPFFTYPFQEFVGKNNTDYYWLLRPLVNGSNLPAATRPLLSAFLGQGSIQNHAVNLGAKIEQGISISRDSKSYIDKQVAFA
jgi:hypothetical protein